MINTPLFHLFRTVNKYYLYDANRNEIFPVIEEDYRLLQQLKEGKKSLVEISKISDSIGQLINEGYLSLNRIEKIEHSLVHEVEISSSRRVEKITLQLTQNCNFRCTYCNYTNNTGSQRTHSDKKMTLETGKKAIMYLRNHSVDSKELNVGFYGGEPLLEFELLKQLMIFASESLKGKPLTFAITTNATLINDEMLEFFENYDINILISIDGPKHINDRNRVFVSGNGTFDKVIERLKYIHDNYPKIYKKTSINIVVDPSQDLGEILSLLTDYPFLKDLQIMSSVIDDSGSPVKNQYAELFLQKSNYHYFLCYLAVMGKYPTEKITPLYLPFVNTILDCKKIQPRPGFAQTDSPGGPCMPGEVRLMATVDENLIVCERISETAQSTILGNLNDGVNIEKAKALLNVSQITENECRNCWAVSGCVQCAKTAISGDKDKFSAKLRLSECANSKYDFESRLRQLVFFREAAEIYNRPNLV